MIKQTWTISNEEKSRILNLHEQATKNLYLFNEQVAQYTDNFGDNFESGKYILSPAFQQSINDKVVKLVEFIKGKNLKNFKILITPGESQVTNQAGFERVGSLAESRAKTLKDYLEKVLPKMMPGVTPKIEVTKPIIGTTPYDKTKDKKDDQRYKNEQFVRVSVVLDTEDKPKPDLFANAASDGESMYLNQRLWGSVLYQTVKTNSITDPGIINPNYQPFYLVEYKPDTVPHVVIGKYKIPWQWWNSTIFGNSFTQEQVNYIKANFKVS